MDYPDIFVYEDYRPFLRDWFKARKKLTGRKGTSAFARLAGCVPGHVQNVITGRRKLQQELVPGFCQGLGLNAAPLHRRQLVQREQLAQVPAIPGARRRAARPGPGATSGPG